MADLSATPFARRLDDLVESARAARDSAFNTLDAVNRQTKSACEGLVREAQQILEAAAEQGADRPAAAAERDDRFDPADEWELPGATALPPRDDPPRADHESDYSETDYPDTWLR